MVGREQLEVRNTEGKNSYCQIAVLLKTFNEPPLSTQQKQYVLKLLSKTLHSMTPSSFLSSPQPVLYTLNPSVLILSDYELLPTHNFHACSQNALPAHLYLAIIYSFSTAQLQHCFCVLLSSIITPILFRNKNVVYSSAIALTL